MKLSDIAKQLLSEDSWGNNPSAAAGQNPGNPPSAVSPAPQENSKFYDVSKDFQNFKTTIEAQEEKAKKTFDEALSKQLINKRVTVRASKGAVGQVEKDYDLTVASVDITYLKDRYYVILKGTDKKDYYINDGFKIKIDGAGEETETAGSPSESPAKKSLGGIVHPQNMGVATK